MIALPGDSTARRSTIINYITFGIIGLLASFLLAWMAVRMLLGASLADVQPLTRPLAFSGAMSLIIGFAATWVTSRISRSLLFTLISAYIWSAVLVITNFWNGARLMFFNSDHDLPLAVALLVFASILSAAFGLAVTVRIVADLRELSNTAFQIASGNLDSRSNVRGRDEVSQVAESFNDMAEKLEEAEGIRLELEQLRRDLVSWTSHDLRTPLTSMRAMVEAMRDGIVDDPVEVQRYFKNILNDIERLNTLMNDLFEYSQLESGGMKYELENHSMLALIEDICEQFEAYAIQNDLSLECDVSRLSDPIIRMDPRLIGRVISNLVKNSCRHAGSSGAVTIRAIDRSDDVLEVAVIDDGSGFNEEDLPHVFEQFFRGEEARSRAKGGGGLGLAIAKSIVEGHGGEISAANVADGRGAIVTFKLPR